MDPAVLAYFKAVRAAADTYRKTLPTGAEKTFITALYTASDKAVKAASAIGVGAVTTGATVMPIHVVIRDASADNWPNASNTGHRIGLSASGSVSSTANNEVISGKDITGNVNITHSGVVLRDCRITATGQPYGVNVNLSAGGSVTIEYCTVIGGQNAITGSNFVAQYNNISGFAEDAIKAGSNSTISHNYIHGATSYSYADGIEIASGSNITVADNWIDMSLGATVGSCNSAIYCGSYVGGISNITIRNNFLNGGAYNLVLVNDGNGVPASVTVTDNHFGPNATSGYMRVDTSSTLTWNSNANHATGEEIKLPATTTSTGTTGGGTTGSTGGSGTGTGTVPNTSWWQTGLNNPTGPKKAMTTVSGPVYLTSTGQTYDGKKVNGTIYVQANNITITNCECESIENQATGTVIEDCRILGPGGEGGIVYSNYTVRRTEIRGTFDGLKIFDNVTIDNCWIHDMLRGGGSAPTSTGGSGNSAGGYTHNDGGQCSAGTNIRITNSRFENCGYNSGLFFDNDQGVISNVTIDSCYIQGGNFALWVVDSASSGGAYGIPSGLSFTNLILGAPNTWAPSFAGYYSIQTQNGSKIACTWSNIQAEYKSGTGTALKALPSSYPQYSDVPASERWRT